MFSKKNYVKKKLKVGNGVKYVNGKGDSWLLHYGYSNLDNKESIIPYMKKTEKNNVIYIPLNNEEEQK